MIYCLPARGCKATCYYFSFCVRLVLLGICTCRHNAPLCSSLTLWEKHMVLYIMSCTPPPYLPFSSSHLHLRWEFFTKEKRTINVCAYILSLHTHMHIWREVYLFIYLFLYIHSFTHLFIRSFTLSCQSFTYSYI